MPKYNSAFFSLYENVFLVLRKNFGEEKTLDLFSQIMEFGLKKSYDSAGFKKGDPKDFVKVVGSRDKKLGLVVKFPVINKDKIVYRFYTDPFPNLKGHVNSGKLAGTYMEFKMKYMLGKDWSYKMTKNIWKGNQFTEFVITKSQNK
jgi:hypothetical protein